MNFKDRNIAAVAATGAKVRGLSSAWIVHLAVLGVLTLLLGVLNAHAIAAAVRVWWVSPTFSHCFLVIPVSAWFVWRRRHVLAAMTPVVYPRALWLAPLPVLLLLLGTLAQIYEARQLAFIALLQVLILSVLGLQVYRKILFPSLFLFFLVPMGGYLIAPLQTFTTHFISAGLTLLGIPHYTEVNVIQLSNGDYEVAEACAGLRFLIATIAVGVLFVHMTYRKWHKIVLFLAACFVIPVIANGFRALGIVLVAHWSDNRIAHGVDHIIYGWGFLVAILLTLMLIGMRFADPLRDEDGGETAAAAPAHPRTFALTVVLALVAICFVPATVYWQEQRPLRVDAAAFAQTPALPGWQTGAVSGEWSPAYAAADAHLSFSMRTAGAPAVDVFVEYYAGGAGSRHLVSRTNRLWNEGVWHPLSQTGAQARLGARAVHLGEAEIASAGLTRMVWWTYWSGGCFTTSGVRVKLEHLRHALSGDGAALVAVSTPVNGDPAGARARLARAFAKLGPVLARLDKTDGR